MQTTESMHVVTRYILPTRAGGCDGWNYFNDCHAFSFEAREWAPVRVTGTAPGARSAPATVVHEGQGAMYVFGGYDGGRSLNDLFRFAAVAGSGGIGDLIRVSVQVGCEALSVWSVVRERLREYMEVAR